MQAGGQEFESLRLHLADKFNINILYREAENGTLKTEYRRNKNLRNCQEENYHKKESFRKKEEFHKKELEKTEEKTSEEDGVTSVYK